MKNLYALGIFTTTLILIQFEFLLLLLLYGIFYLIGLNFLGSIISIAFMLILGIGHVITTHKSIKHLEDKSIDFEKVLKEKSEKNYILNSPVVLGTVWRIQTEWKYIKKVAKLQFREVEIN